MLSVISDYAFGIYKFSYVKQGHRGRERMVVEFTTTCAISDVTTNVEA
jgi:hypothetical protein